MLRENVCLYVCLASVRPYDVLSLGPSDMFAIIIQKWMALKQTLLHQESLKLLPMTICEQKRRFYSEHLRQESKKRKKQISVLTN